MRFALSHSYDACAQILTHSDVNVGLLVNFNVTVIEQHG